MKEKQIKDREFTLATIKVTKVREVFRNGGIFHFKDKHFHADIRQFGTTTGYQEPTLKKLLTKIKEHLTHKNGN